MSKPRSGAARRVGIGLLAGALALLNIALAPSAGAADPDVIRYAGATRYGTAAAIAGDTAFDGATTAIVATGENYPDALAASALAGAESPAPIILTQKDTYTADAKSALGDLGVDDVIIVGGTAAVSTTVENAIKADGFNVTRQAGVDRYETAAKIGRAADAAGAGTPVGGLKTALIATGLNFPDALAGGTGAYSDQLPLFLVNTGVPAATKSALTDLGIKQVVILGGTAAVSDAVETELEGIVGNPAVRAAGVNRFGTAAEFADWEIDALDYNPSSVVAATGLNFPDALAAGPLGGEKKAPILLTASCPAETVAWLQAHASAIVTLFLSGGTAVIDQATQDCLVAALGGTTPTNQTVTGRPELVSATILSTYDSTQATGTDISTIRPEGTLIAFDFDETVVTPTAASFVLYKSDTAGDDPWPGDQTAIDDDDDSIVNVLFEDLTTKDDDAATGTADFTVAGVYFGAVQDNSTDSLDNPDGSVSLITNGTASGLAAGETDAPDLLSVSGFREGNEDACNAEFGDGDDCAAVDFVFDEEATPIPATDYFYLLNKDSEYAACLTDDDTSIDSGGAVPGGSGTETLTALCEPFDEGDSDDFAGQPTADNTARGLVYSGTVEDDAGNQNDEVQASDSPDAATDTPDLVSVEFRSDSSASRDIAIFTFDATILTGSITAGSFCTMDAEGDSTCGSPAGTAELDTTGKKVAIYRVAGSLDDAVSGQAYSGAVDAAAGDNDSNEDDEEGALAGTATDNDPGITDGPDLTAVVLAAGAGTFEDTEVAAYLFDEDVDDASADDVGDAALFQLFVGNGDQMICASDLALLTNDDAGADAAPENTVICGSFAFTGDGPAHAAGVATNAEVKAAVLGTVAEDAVTDDDDGVANPVGGKPTAGGNGVKEQ